MFLAPSVTSALWIALRRINKIPPSIATLLSHNTMLHETDLLETRTKVHALDKNAGQDLDSAAMSTANLSNSGLQVEETGRPHVH